MHGESKQDGCRIDSHAEHLVILQVAGEARGRTRERIYSELSDLGARRVDEAVASLAAVGVVVLAGHSVRQSPALERIDALGYITV
jgi:hypothetical protein